MTVWTKNSQVVLTIIQGVAINMIYFEWHLSGQWMLDRPTTFYAGIPILLKEIPSQMPGDLAHRTNEARFIATLPAGNPFLILVVALTPRRIESVSRLEYLTPATAGAERTRLFRIWHGACATTIIPTCLQQARIIAAKGRSVKFLLFLRGIGAGQPLSVTRGDVVLHRPIHAPTASRGSPLLIASVVTRKSTVPSTGASIA